MLDYLITFICGVYVGTLYDCKPVISYMSAFIQSLVPPKQKTPDSTDKDETDTPVSPKQRENRAHSYPVIDTTKKNVKERKSTFWNMF